MTHGSPFGSFVAVLMAAGVIYFAYLVLKHKGPFEGDE